MGELEPDAGGVEWGYETHPGYFAQDYGEQFENPSWSAEEWITSFAPGRTIGFVRGELGRVLFSGDDATKRLGTLSGGEAARLVFCRLAIEKPNVLVLDEPTNHLDLESIEALVKGLRAYDGPLILGSHDRWFVGRLANRIVEITEDAIRDFAGTYEDYVHFCGDDHLDVDTVVLRAQRERRERRAGKGGDSEGEDDAPRPRASSAPAGARNESARPSPNRMREMRKRRDRLTDAIDRAEERLAEIDALFCEPGFYERSDPDEVAALEEERARLAPEIEALVADWEEAERDLGETA